MRIKYTIFFLAAMLAACTNEILPGTVVEEAPESYTLVVTATKGNDDTTKALSLDGKTLNATWKAGDAVQVYHVSNPGTMTEMESTTPDATLSAQGSGMTTTLSGSFTGSYTPAVDDVLRLRFLPNPDYTTQEGTLDYIATHCDYAVATITVASVDALTSTVTATAPASFENQQAIVKFSLKQPDGTTPLPVTSLTVNVGSTTYNVTPPAASSDIYVAVKKTSNKTVTLRATDGTDFFRYEKTGVSFAVGKYYAIGVKMFSLNLSTLTSDFTAQDGDVLTGSLNGNYKVSIADGATVTLGGVTINGTNDYSYKWAGITCLGDATIVLADGTTNSVKGFVDYYPGILPAVGKTLTIEGTGSLTASSNGKAAGIGSGNISCGNIHIKSGTIKATGEKACAGIGSGNNEDVTCGTITISGGNVTAIGGESSAAIGCGMGGNCGNILIEGGTIVATAADSNRSTCIGTRNGTCPSVIFTRGITRMTLSNADKTGIAEFICASNEMMADTYNLYEISGNAVNWLNYYGTDFTELFKNWSFSTGVWVIAP